MTQSKPGADLGCRAGCPPSTLNVDELLGRADAAWAIAGRAQLELLTMIREVGRREAWHDDGARDLAHWVSMRYGISSWKAHRWVAAADALASLPRISRALERGVLGVNKVVELTRFVTPDTEAELIVWAKERPAGAIKARAELERRRENHEIADAERERFLRWWYSDDGSRLGVHGEIPADQGAVVVGALRRLSDVLPDVSTGDGITGSASGVDARRADALSGSARVQSRPTPTQIVPP